MLLHDPLAVTGLTESFSHMFQLKVPLAEKIIRPILVYIALVILLRIFGKRELAQLNPFDFVVLLSASNTVQNAIIGEDNSLIGGLVGALALFAVNYGVMRFLFRHRRLDQLFEGDPRVLIKGGEVQNAGLAKELMSRSELLTVVRRQGFDSLEEIEQCILEPGGVFVIRGRVPTSETQRFDALMARLDRLEEKLASLGNGVH